MEVLEWLKENIWWTALAVFLFWHRKYVYQTFIFTPLAGGNGKIQMDELMKGIIAVMFIWAMHRDGHRDHEWPYFSDVFYASLLMAVCAIAGLKEFLKAKQKDDEHKTNN
jgi:hypothetical protein